MENIEIWQMTFHLTSNYNKKNVNEKNTVFMQTITHTKDLYGKSFPMKNVCDWFPLWVLCINGFYVIRILVL